MLAHICDYCSKLQVALNAQGFVEVLLIVFTKSCRYSIVIQGGADLPLFAPNVQFTFIVILPILREATQQSLYIYITPHNSP